MYLSNYFKVFKSLALDTMLGNHHHYAPLKLFLFLVIVVIGGAGKSKPLPCAG
jgi:hypothetical protein